MAARSIASVIEIVKQPSLKTAAGAHHSRTHGMAGSPTYRIWSQMKRRCENKNHKSFEDYGGRGISVCEQWAHSFENFLADMGERPSPQHSIDRFPNQNGNYEPSNCRWATSIEQNRNRRDNRRITANGETLLLIEWAEKLGIDARRIHSRLASGWTEQDAINGRRSNPVALKPRPPWATCATCGRKYQASKVNAGDQCKICRSGGDGTPRRIHREKQNKDGRRVTSRSVMIEAYGETKTLAEWSRDHRCRVPYTALLFRINRGWSGEEAVSKPNRQKKLGITLAQETPAS